MDRFTQILFDLGKEIGTELYPDPNRICQLNYEDKLSLQLHYIEAKEEVVVAALVCEVPPGKFREKLLMAAMESNAVYPRPGTLAYVEAKNQLLMFENLFVKGLTGESLHQFLQKFIASVLEWKEAVERGKALPVE